LRWPAAISLMLSSSRFTLTLRFQSGCIMLGAFLTTIFFSLSTIYANRSIAAVGITRANLGRLLVALVCLGAYAHTFGRGSAEPTQWFMLSG